MDENSSQPNLQPAGAGLPLPELYIAKLRFWLYRRKHSVEDFRTIFESELNQILHLMKQFDSTSGALPVLISRIRGMEDSSRNWSAFMTLDHLSIVNAEIGRTIELLVQGKVPEGKVKIAEVKPDPKCDKASIETFQKVALAFLDSFDASDQLKTKSKRNHPWFGPLDAFSWLALNSFHMNLHRRQIEKIAKNVKQ